MQSSEHREQPRSPVSLPLRVYSQNNRLLLQACSVDLSVSGVLIHGAGPLQIGQPVRVEVSRGNARNPLSLTAKVVRLATPRKDCRRHEVALRFTDLNPLDQAILTSIIDQQGGSRVE